MMGRALSPFDGQAHIDAVAKGQTAVGRSPAFSLCFFSFSACYQSTKPHRTCIMSDWVEEWQSFVSKAAPPGMQVGVHLLCSR